MVKQHAECPPNSCNRQTMSEVSKSFSFTQTVSQYEVSVINKVPFGKQHNYAQIHFRRISAYNPTNIGLYVSLPCI